MHLEQVLGEVPESERCQCRAQGTTKRRKWFSR